MEQPALPPREKAKRYIEQSFDTIGLYIGDLDDPAWQELVELTERVLFSPESPEYLGGALDDH